MKKLYIILAVAMMALTVNAQARLTLSTYNGTQIAKYDGQQMDVTMTRLLFMGWNTFSVPFDMSEQQLVETLGPNFKLERLVGVSQQGNEITLDFQDCRAMGVQANVPYILYYTGETGNKKFAVKAEIVNREPSLTLHTQTGVKVTMSGATVKTAGTDKYGILAINNSEATFTRVEGANEFYATRCFITTSAGNYALRTRHLGANEAASINDIAAATDIVDVYNLLGMRVASKIQAADVNNLAPNIYIVNGRKVLVK